MTCRRSFSPASRPSTRCANAGLGGYDFTVPLLAGDHVTDDAGTGFVHTAPGHGVEDFEAWMSAKARPREGRHRDQDPLHRRRRRPLHRRGPRLRGRGRHHRRGQEGPGQPEGHRRPVRRRRDGGARPPQAPVPALLALQEAGHLPQHAAVVRRRWTRTSATGPRCAPVRSRRSTTPASCRPPARTACAA